MTYCTYCQIQCDYTNELLFHALMGALFLDESKLGRLFRDIFGDTIPPPAIALFATAVSFRSSFNIAVFDIIFI